MKDNESKELVPDWKDLVLKKQVPERVCIKTYISWEEFADWAKEAQKAGVRPNGLKLIIQNRKLGEMKTPRHFYKANTKNLGKFIKGKLFPSWKATELDREMKKRELQRQAAELGLVVERK